MTNPDNFTDRVAYSEARKKMTIEQVALESQQIKADYQQSNLDSLKFTNIPRLKETDKETLRILAALKNASVMDQRDIGTRARHVMEAFGMDPLQVEHDGHGKAYSLALFLEKLEQLGIK